MTNEWKCFLLIVVTVVVTISGCKWSEEESVPLVVGATIDVGENKKTVLPSQQPQFCPQVKELVIKDDLWQSIDGKWKSFTHSSASKVLSFLGAQWVGIKVGKIICLYQTNEAVAFPLAVEQLINQPVVEPTGYGWSALSGNRKFCKSANVADCTYFIEVPKDIANIYKEIEYNPRKE